jgi:hypothetical protein
MEKSRYREINFDELAGISRSLFTLTARMPRTKKSRAGLVRFSSNKFMFISFVTVDDY